MIKQGIDTYISPRRAQKMLEKQQAPNNDPKYLEHQLHNELKSQHDNIERLQLEIKAYTLLTKIADSIVSIWLNKERIDQQDVEKLIKFEDAVNQLIKKL